MTDDFADSYLGQLRQKIGHDMVHVPGAVVVIENSIGQVLLQKRADFNIWSMPGGAPEHNETTLQQAIRETKEETGLTVHNLTPFAHLSHPDHQIIHYPNDDVCHFHDLYFHTTDFEGKLIASNSETLELRWYHPEQFPDVMLSCTQGIRAFLAYKQTGKFQID